MDIGIVVFAYNRSRHLGKVLEGLRENREVSKLYIFQDGLKCEEHQNEWEMTRQVIEDIDWCETAYQLSHKNKGLACSIVDGISAVFAENDAVIVLEDDCVPTANFVNFMVQCFENIKMIRECILYRDIAGRLICRKMNMMCMDADVSHLGAGEHGKIDGNSIVRTAES